MTPGSPEWKVMIMAVEVAMYPPLRHDEEHTYAARVPWKVITELREALDAAGIDWRKAKSMQR